MSALALARAARCASIENVSTLAAFVAWFRSAESGGRICYFTGQLARSRRRPGLHQLADGAGTLCSLGLVSLVQIRLAADDYKYLAERRGLAAPSILNMEIDAAAALYLLAHAALDAPGGPRLRAIAYSTKAGTLARDCLAAAGLVRQDPGRPAYITTAGLKALRP